LEYHYYIQWKWTGHLGQVPVLYEPYYQQALWSVDPLFNNCFHGVIQPRKWLKAGMFWDLLNFRKCGAIIRINDALGHLSPEKS